MPGDLSLKTAWKREGLSRPGPACTSDQALPRVAPQPSFVTGPDQEKIHSAPRGFAADQSSRKDLAVVHDDQVTLLKMTPEIPEGRVVQRTAFSKEHHQP